MRGAGERVVRRVEDGQQDVVRTQAIGSGDEEGPGEDPRRRGRAGHPVGVVGRGGPGTDERPAGGADTLRGEPVRVEHLAQPGHTTAEHDGGDEQVLGVEVTEPGLHRVLLREEDDLAAVLEGGEGDGERDGLHAYRIPIVMHIGQRVFGDDG